MTGHITFGSSTDFLDHNNDAADLRGSDRWSPNAIMDPSSPAGGLSPSYSGASSSGSPAAASNLVRDDGELRRDDQDKFIQGSVGRDAPPSPHGGPGQSIPPTSYMIPPAYNPGYVAQPAHSVYQESLQLLASSSLGYGGGYAQPSYYNPYDFGNQLVAASAGLLGGGYPYYSQPQEYQAPPPVYNPQPTQTLVNHHYCLNCFGHPSLRESCVYCLTKIG